MQTETKSLVMNDSKERILMSQLQNVMKCASSAENHSIYWVNFPSLSNSLPIPPFPSEYISLESYQHPSKDKILSPDMEMLKMLHLIENCSKTKMT